jgi:hypothetical protein
MTSARPLPLPLSHIPEPRFGGVVMISDIIEGPRLASHVLSIRSKSAELIVNSCSQIATKRFKGTKLRI